MSNWSPQEYLAEARALECGERFLQELDRETKDQYRQRLPILLGLKHLAALADSHYDILYARMRSSEGLYRVFNIRKRSGGYRQITVPCPSLKIVQEWINSNILSLPQPHIASTAYTKGSSPLENARRHCQTKWLIKLDITDFFESISEKQVYHAFRAIGYKPITSFQLARLCTRTSDESYKYKNRGKRWKKNGENIGHLPQGAPSSPKLSNLVCVALDEKLQAISDRFGCTYTRYADDLTFSANDLNRTQVGEIIGEVDRTLGDFGFQRNRRKTHVSPPGARKVVTGLLVDSDRPRLTKAFKNQILRHLYFSAKYKPHGHCERIGFSSLPSFMDHLHGLITYAEHVDQDFGKSCRERFNGIDWQFIEDLAQFAQ